LLRTLRIDRIQTSPLQKIVRKKSQHAVSDAELVRQFVTYPYPHMAVIPCTMGRAGGEGVHTTPPIPSLIPGEERRTEPGRRSTAVVIPKSTIVWIFKPVGRSLKKNG